MIIEITDFSHVIMFALQQKIEETRADGRQANTATLITFSEIWTACAGAAGNFKLNPKDRGPFVTALFAAIHRLEDEGIMWFYRTGKDETGASRILHGGFTQKYQEQIPHIVFSHQERTRCL